ncbi:MAG: M23 family metallopeptidase [Gemmatimonadaceae bacterium]
MAIQNPESFVGRLARIGAACCAGLLLACAAAGAVWAQSPSLPPFLELRVPKPPTLATGNGESFLVHELHVTNFSADTVTLTQVDVVAGASESYAGTGSAAASGSAGGAARGTGVGAGRGSAGGTDVGGQRVLLTVADSALRRNVARPGIGGPAAERTRIAPGSRAVVYLWVPVDRDAARPLTALRHRVTIDEGTGDSAETKHLAGAQTPVHPPAEPIGPPLRGGVWLTGNGPSSTSGHRRALIPVGGKPSIAQRFAIDYVKVGDADRRFTGDSLENSSYHAYGEDALAVADGIVVAVKDGIPENVPGITSRAVPITLETVGGNHVIIDIGGEGERYAFYAHLQPGSLRVQVGDRVRRGQVVGLVGNSGNSTEPHLHFHVSDGNSPLGSEGIPYSHHSFDVVGHCPSLVSACEREPAVTRHGEQPMGNTLIRFPR